MTARAEAPTAQDKPRGPAAPRLRERIEAARAAGERVEHLERALADLERTERGLRSATVKAKAARVQMPTIEAFRARLGLRCAGCGDPLDPFDQAVVVRDGKRVVIHGDCQLATDEIE